MHLLLVTSPHSPHQYHLLRPYSLLAPCQLNAPLDSCATQHYSGRSSDGVRSGLDSLRAGLTSAWRLPLPSATIHCPHRELGARVGNSAKRELLLGHDAVPGMFVTCPAWRTITVHSNGVTEELCETRPFNAKGRTTPPLA